LEQLDLVSTEKEDCNPRNVHKGICDIIGAVRPGCVPYLTNLGRDKNKILITRNEMVEK